MSEEYAVETQPTFGQRLGKALLWLLRFVLRLLFVILIGAALGVGIYFGFMALYQQFVQPVQVHTIQLDVLSTRQAQSEELNAQRLADMQDRLDEVEVRGDAAKGAVAGLEAQLDTVQEAQSSQADSMAGLAALQAEIEALQADLQAVQETQQAAQVDLEVAQVALQDARGLQEAEIEALQEAQDQLEADMAALQADQKAIEQSLKALGTEVEALTEAVAAGEALAEAVTASEEKLASLAAELQGERSPEALYRELQIVRAMELITRGRLFLGQNNLGQAQSDVEAGRDLLTALLPQVSLAQAVVVADIIDLLDGALDSLPNAPVTAADGLDGAWQLLVVGLPPDETALPPLEPSPGVTATLTPTLTVTVTPEITTTVTPTPTTSS